MANLMQGLDEPRTEQQELFYDLEDASAIILWSVGELTSMGRCNKTPDEAIALMKMCELLEAQQLKLRGYADEVRDQRITRAKPA